MNSSTRLVLLIALLGVRTAFALDPERHITELVHRVWDNKSGVPADIRALAQTSDGYLWVGSLRGLYRFDGIQFQKFEPEAGARLPSQQIRSLFAVPGNGLWIGYRWGGVSFLAAGRVINYNSVDGFPEGDVHGITRDGQGRIWAASSGGLACFEAGRWHSVGSESSFPGSSASALLVDHAGALWVAADHRIAVLPAHASKFELADEPYNGQVTQLAEAPDGTVWMVETTRAVRPLKRPGQGTPYKGLTRDDCQERFPDTWQTEPRCRRPDDLEVRVGSQAFLFDQNGGFWITTLGDGLRRAPYPLQLPQEPLGEFSDALEHFTSKDGLSSDFVIAISEDREGTVWVATRDGLDQFRNAALAPVVLGPAAASVSIVADDDGYVLAMGNDRRLFRFHDAHNKTSVTYGQSRTQWLYRDLFGSIWGTGVDGGCRFVGDACEIVLDIPSEKQHLWVRIWRLAVDGNHRVWAYVSETGLFTFENGRWSQFRSVPPAPTGATPTTQYTDPAGRVWFGFQDGRLLTVTDGRVHLYSSEDGLALGEIKAIASVSTHIWVGGERGLAILSGSRFIPVLPYDKPAFGSVSGIVAGDDGSLWLNEYRGIVRVSASEVSAILQDRSHPTQYDVLNSFDGLPGATEQFTSAPTAIRGTDGRLWFATTNGAVWVDPRHLYRNMLPPPVVIQSIVADNRTLSPSGKLELPGRTSNLQITYAGLSLSVPERVQFRYRLKGLDDQWQSAGTRRTADYTKLAPGSYDFQVIASNDSGVWNDVGTSLRIRIIPAWYQTWWFYALCVLLVAAALAALYRVRLAQVRTDTRRLLEARLSERERMARDLHDTLLQGFQGLMFRLQAVRQLLPGRPGDAEKFLDSAMEAGDQAIGEGRDAVQSLRSSSADDGDLATALGALGTELGEGIPSASKPQYRVVVEGRPRELAVDIRDEAYRTVREAVRNAYQHAKARHIETELSFGDVDLCIRVRDDGIGVDPQILAQGQRPGHWGLPGMRERSEGFGGRLRVWSNRHAGTEVELRIPASVAYQQPPPSRARGLRGLFASVPGRTKANRGG